MVYDCSHAENLESLQEKIMIIGYCYLVGDLIHKGHISYLKNCKALCDKLVCGVLTDKAVRERKLKPILSFDERIEIIGSLKYIDSVVAQDEYDPTNNCKLICPDILFESSDHSIWGNNDERKIIGLPYYPEQSSSRIKRRVRNGHSSKKHS